MVSTMLFRSCLVRMNVPRRAVKLKSSVFVAVPFLVNFFGIKMNIIRMMAAAENTMGDKRPKSYPAKFTKEELKGKLTPEQYHVTQERGTESAFSGEYWDKKEDGTYKCIVCGENLFSSDTKFESGCGWPSFYDVLEKGRVKRITDSSHGMIRTEVVCANCGAHMGHVFDDGPKPTKERYCINSASLKFGGKQTEAAKEEL